MNSKEALENIGMTKTNNIKSESLSKPRIMYLVKELKKKEIQTIKQDLDKLEKMEKENEQLNQTIQTIRQNTKEEFDHLLDKFYELGDENAKLKKVIDILKKKYIQTLDICTDDYHNYRVLCELNSINEKEIATQEEYELLKEVLGNKWYNKPLPAFAPEENYNYSFVNNCLQKAEKYDCEGLEKEIKKYSEEKFENE